MSCTLFYFEVIFKLKYFDWKEDETTINIRFRKKALGNTEKYRKTKNNQAIEDLTKNDEATKNKDMEELCLRDMPSTAVNTVKKQVSCTASSCAKFGLVWQH